MKEEIDYKKEINKKIDELKELIVKLQERIADYESKTNKDLYLEGLANI